MKGAVAYAQVQALDFDTVVSRYTPLVQRIAHHLKGRLPASVQIDDLIQAGMIGLLEASRQYDASQGASFETYAGIRIRGAMLDEVRRYDWTPRSVHRKAREISEAMYRIERRTGRDARDTEVAEELGISLDEYHKILRDAVGCRLFSIEELSETGDAFLEDHSGGDADLPVEQLSRERFKAALADAIASLPERERLSISLYYEEEMNLKEIGQVLGVSESRVCQINSQALLRLRARMRDWLGG
ncbi:RNA polymerase sigma factor for flagellar operon FliA [Methylomarinovum caldicuralii]|uniref:RNA polymerase sigma factor FliA n=1 Tax=Methylomarinovum caldicuralii TaxID=438856 RepID=A0AAU9CUK5_9GAMM|nr:RNA polymerase sigma factor FliA [Methylomarinovum caldicuralii]BCX81592.1 RNA polymerase sigma factor for flagellar operon FliA [Methylomarinovum caldicuralii]